MASKNTNIYVESDFNNIFIVNPNKVINDDGTVDDRFVKQEDLVMYANLECSLQPRSRLIVGEDSQSLQTIQIASVNFLKPGNKKYLTTDWTDLQTKNIQENNNINSELLGITNISYKVGPSFVPTITVSLEDIRGRALFESGNDSIYSVFFNLPYPTFYLTMKGYYGKAVRYPLILQKFHGSFDQSSGNFLITLNFIGYKFNVLTDVAQGYLMATPQMYTKRYLQNIQTSSSSQVDASVGTINNNDSPVNSIITQEGYEKIKEVYKLYKSKGLISQDFPELTVQQLINKLENFEKSVLDNFGQISVEELTNAKTYESILDDFNREVFTAKSPKSWFNKNLDSKNFYIVKDFDGKSYKAYTYKPEIIEFSSTVKELDTLIDEKNNKLNDVPTFGKNGKRYKIAKKVKNTNVYRIPPILIADVDKTETAKQRFNTQNPSSTQINSIDNELNKIQEKIDNEQKKASQNLPNTEQFFFILEGEKYFNGTINEIKKELQGYKNKIESNLTEEMIKLLESSKGIGFNPTIRNVLAVIMASTDAFLRLMNDVHKKAFENRNNLKKKQAVSADVKNEPDSPVYPWPQYSKIIDIDGCQQKFEIKYPGDPEYISETGANDYQAWPEVEFVEEFIKGYLQRQIPPVVSADEENSLTAINRLLVSAFDTPSNISYSDLQIIPFLYEIWERIESIANYQGFVRNTQFTTILNSIQAFEASNIIKGLGINSPQLIQILKFTGFNPNTYFEYLRDVSNGGTGQYWQKLIRGRINTPYLESEINNSSKIINVDLPIINTSVVTNDNEDVKLPLTNYVNSTKTNFEEFTDIYPFTDEEWRSNNLVNSIFGKKYTNFNNTEQTLFFNNFTNKISNYNSEKIIDNTGNSLENRPFTTFKFMTNKIDFPVAQYSFEEFYNSRTPSDFNLTEGYVQYDGYNGLVGNNQTTSILNTPFFVKAIQDGAEKERQNIENPYIEASYYFLNSLPLSTTKETLISKIGNNEIVNGYLAPTFKKFGTVNSIPKLWVCRVGSIWHRYKTFINSGYDILSNTLVNYSYLTNFDPVNFDSQTTYSLTANSTTYDIFLAKNILDDSGQTVDLMNVGFYPKTLNDFYRFYNGIDLYRSNTTIQEDIQKAINNGDLILIDGFDSDISVGTGTTDNGNSYNSSFINTFSVLFKNKLPNQSSGNNYFTAPSFGSRQNQTLSECFNQNGLQIPLYLNQSIFDGSVRVNWGMPNFGYFDSDNINFCNPTEYPKNIFTGNTTQNPFSLLNDNSYYSQIDDLFSVFTKEELDLFEGEFLNFTKSNLSTTDSFNLQNIMRQSMNGNFYNPSETDGDKIVEDAQNLQNKTFNQNISNFVSQNLIFQKGNPTNFDKTTFSYFSSNPLSDVLTNVKKYTDETPDSLPKNGGAVTLSESKSNYPEEWKILELYVGFSTISGFTYSDNGSYITDFFIDNNIAFNIENIEIFSDIIKIYATRKYANLNGATEFNFKSEIDDYLNRLVFLRNNIFEGVFSKIQKSLPSFNLDTDTLDTSATQGMQTKVEYYELFKAINDKWIAGNNYNSETLFEDFLFLDRANRNVGDKVIVDVFKVKNYLKSNQKANVYTIASSIIQDHNFVIFSIPSYVNFYNVQTPGQDPQAENEFEFANKLFGQYTEVDYQSSKPKIVCLYSEKPSEQLNNQGKFNGYNDDSFNLGLSTNNPLIECQTSKETTNDYGLSNKVVGFSVDFGLQNQGVFENVQVSQDLGKATSESLQMEYDMANLSKGVKSSTQNVSLYNIYKNRSYKATVTAFGNAIIQPTMYFVLRNVPLFSGPYLIDEVSHVITNGNFKTTFTGTRQRIYTLPLQNQLLEVIRNSFITKLINDAVNKKEVNKGLTSNIITEKNDISNSISAELTVSPNQTCTPISDYSTYENILPVEFISDFVTIKNSVVSSLSSKSDAANMNKVVFTLFYLATANSDGFKYYNYNLATIPLGGSISKWGGDLPKLFNQQYTCLTSADNQSTSYATFPSVTNCVNFCYDKYKDYFTVGITDFEDENVFVSGFTKTWIERFPQDRLSETPNIYDNYRTGNTTQFNYLKTKVTDCYNIMKSMGI